MDPELQKQLAAMIAKLLDATQNAATWSSAQVPLLVQEKITYGRIEHTLGVVICAAIAYASYHSCQRFFRIAKEASNLSGEEVGGVIAVLASSIGFLVSIAFAIAHLNWALMAWFAPRLFIVEWLSSLVKK